MTEPILTDIPMDAFLEAIDALAAAVARDGWRPDYVVGVGRGGLVPATWMSHAIGLPMLSIDLSAKLADFCDDLLVKLAARAAAGARLLVVDDINDSGGTILHLRESLKRAGAPDEAVRFAVLIDNVRSRARGDYRAQEIDRAVTKDWFVFPWEAVARREAILRDWGENPDRTR